MPDKIKKDVIVTLHYRLLLDDGTLVEETDSEEPLMYLHGHENIISGLERELEGLKAGDKKTVVVEPEDAYGMRDSDAYQEVSLNDFPDDFEPEVGMYLELTDEDGEVSEAEVAEVSEDFVILDFNHPLAGERLEFQIEIVELREATPEELDHGHVHEDGHSH